MSAFSETIPRCLAQGLSWLKLLPPNPPYTIRLSNRSLAHWKFELVAAGAFRPQLGRLVFYLWDPVDHCRYFAASLTEPGDSLYLQPDGIYHVEVHTRGGKFLRFFRLVDAHGCANGCRFFIDTDTEGLDPAVRLFDGNLHGDSVNRPFQHPSPGIFEIPMNFWP